MASNGDLVFICSGAPGLMILDASDPSAPQLLGTLDTPGSCTDVAVLGNYLLVADGAVGLQTVDVSDPVRPEIVQTFTPGTTTLVPPV